MTTEYKIEKDIVRYIMQDMEDIINDGISDDINNFPMTKILSEYLHKNKLGVEIISGIMYDILMQEYIVYITK